MSQRPIPDERHPVLDVGAALLAGALAGCLFLILNILLTPRILGGNEWTVLRYFAAIVLGDEALPPPSTFAWTPVFAGAAVTFVFAIAATLLIAGVLHRWGVWTGLAGGAAFGLALYAINIYTMTYFFPWLFQLRSDIFALAHVLFGATAGGLYEAFEDEPERIAGGTP